MLAETSRHPTMAYLCIYLYLVCVSPFSSVKARKWRSGDNCQASAVSFDVGSRDHDGTKVNGLGVGHLYPPNNLSSAGLLFKDVCVCVQVHAGTLRSKEGTGSPGVRCGCEPHRVHGAPVLWKSIKPRLL